MQQWGYLRVKSAGHECYISHRIPDQGISEYQLIYKVEPGELDDQIPGILTRKMIAELGLYGWEMVSHDASQQTWYLKRPLKLPRDIFSQKIKPYDDTDWFLHPEEDVQQWEYAELSVAGLHCSIFFYRIPRHRRLMFEPGTPDEQVPGVLAKKLRAQLTRHGWETVNDETSQQTWYFKRPVQQQPEKGRETTQALHSGGDLLTFAPHVTPAAASASASLPGAFQVPVTIELFLRESNAIEDVFDNDSLKQAYLAWHYLIQQEKLSVSNILQAHTILMRNQPLAESDKGNFRRVEVTVGGQIKQPSFFVPDLMAQWIEGANRLEDEITDHIVFEDIHPFVDGNGRMGRILLNWQRVKKGLPILVLSAKDRHEYYKWFK